MWRLGIAIGCAVVFVGGGCNKRALDGRYDGSTVDAVGVARPDGRSRDAPPTDVPAADARVADTTVADTPPAEASFTDAVHVDTAFDGGSRDLAIDGATDAGVAPTPDGATDAGVAPTPDGACAVLGNGRPPQPGPLFGDPVTFAIPGGANAQSIAVGDVTGDGRADVVVGSVLPAIVVYAQTASGGLAPPVSFPLARGTGTPAFPDLIDLGDVNGDRWLDVVFPRDDGVGVMLGDGAGGFRAEQRLPTLANGGGTGYVVAVGDLNGDERADIVSASWGTTGVNVYFQDATGAMMPPQFFSCPHSGYESIAVGDVNGDGLNDIAIAGNQQNSLCVLFQQPGGFAGVSVPISTTTDGVAIGNFGGGDCGPAIAFAKGGNQPGSQLGVVRWTAAGVFSSPAYLDAYDIPGSMVVADLDGDRRPDIAVMHTGWEAIGVYRGLPTGGLGAEETYASPYVNWGTDRLAVGDVNGDGRADLVSADMQLAILYHR